jgi:hypothetical protein
MKETSLELIRGDTDLYTITFSQADGTPYNITNWIIFLTVKQHYDLTDLDALFQIPVTSHTDPTNGETQIEILHSHTHAAEPGDYIYDIQAVTNDTPPRTYTVLRGPFRLFPDVTKVTSTSGTAGT